MTNLPFFRVLIMQIVYLSERPTYIKTIAGWLYDEWGHLRLNSSLDSAVEKIKKRVKGKDIPSIFVAEADRKPIGTVSLIGHDLEIRPELSPWLASLYVLKDYRRQGIGSKLVNFLESFTQDLNIEKVYLYTPNQQKLYSALGWTEKEELEYLSRRVTIMEKDLASWQPHPCRG
jgi:GNAT superfamily N-acetyltransferase